jgi:site-specific recombinase XerD
MVQCNDKAKYNELEQEYLKQGLEGDVKIGERKIQESNNFSDYAMKFYDGMKNRCSADYIFRCKAAIKDFIKYAGDVSFSSINHQLLKDYEQHLFKRGIARNTVNRIFKKLKQVFADAVKHKVITDNPFDLYKACFV